MNRKRVEAVIDLNMVRHNYNTVKSMAKNSRVICVVKADAYGHGAAEVCRTLEAAGADFFAVACIDEALILRESGIKSDILILGVSSPECLSAIYENDFIQTVPSVEYAEAISGFENDIRIHIKADTGMSRLGLYCHGEEHIKSTTEKIRYIHSLEGLRPEGLFTHFACSDDAGNPMTEAQYKIFTALCCECEMTGINPGMRHCCNSGAVLNFPHMYLDAVRAGILLYGLAPTERPAPGFEPAMSLNCRVDQVLDLSPGDTVSYGAAFTAEKNMKAAVISIGYADGFSRILSQKAVVYINGKQASVLGKICMDMCVADISEIDCIPGDKVTVFGKDQPVYILADQMGTVSYEIICSIKNRVPRKYIN